MEQRDSSGLMHWDPVTGRYEPAPTDRPVDMSVQPPAMEEPPPHISIPDGPEPDANLDPFAIPGSVMPPPVPDGPASLAQQLGDTAIANLHAAARNRIAFMCALTAFTVSVNYLYQALGELEPEDFQHTGGTLSQLTTGVDLLQARLASIETRAQAAE